MTATKAKTINFTYITFLASAVALLILALSSVHLFSQQKTAMDLVTNTFLVKVKLEETTNLLKDVETSQRGYILTEDSAFIRTYHDSKLKLEESILQLSSLISDHPRQLEQLGEITSLIHLRTARLEKSLVFFAAGQKPEMLQSLREGKKIMDRIRSLAARFELGEDELLKQRLAKKQEADRLTSGSILFFSLISFVILIFSFYRLKLENVRRTKAEYTSEQLERKVAERTNEISEMNRRLQEQNILLEKQNEELNSFTFVASHDLKEPLRKIEMFTSLIKRTEDENFSSKSKEYFANIQKATKRMQSLIEGVLTYAQTNVLQEFKSTDLNEILQQTLEILHERIIEKSALVTATDLPTLTAIPEQMDQLFTNLLSNALKYSSPDRTLEISITAEKLNMTDSKNGQPKNFWKINFTDNGIGFNEVHKHKIFQIFQRLHTRSEYSGTGIGLAICKNIVENHHGSISVRSEAGKGSTFSVFLPERQT